jgi:hypothetical protein
MLMVQPDRLIFFSLALQVPTRRHAADVVALFLSLFLFDQSPPFFTKLESVCKTEEVSIK